MQAPAADAAEAAAQPQVKQPTASPAAEAEPEILFKEEQLSQPEPEQPAVADVAGARPEPQDTSAAATAGTRPQLGSTGQPGAAEVRPRPQVRNREQPRGGSAASMRPSPPLDSKEQPRAAGPANRQPRPQSAPTARAATSEAPRPAAPAMQQQRPAAVSRPAQDDSRPSTSESRQIETASAAPAPPTQAPPTTFTGMFLSVAQARRISCVACLLKAG